MKTPAGFAAENLRDALTRLYFDIRKEVRI